jgi:hypothetical protein
MDRTRFEAVIRMNKVLLVGIGALIGSVDAGAQSTTTLPFVTHAAYFSAEMALPGVLDPQVFVLAPNAPAATGPQNIEHVAGIRNARISDDHGLPIYDAQHRALGMTLGQWLGARGAVTLTPLAVGGEKVKVELANLAPGAHFSLFENHFDQTPTAFTPLDGTGRSNSFRARADGTASAVMFSPTRLTHANAVLVVYHSDDKTHGNERGVIGVNAHHQLIARVP